MSIAKHHAEWLSLLEISGPFLSMPVLLRAFPQGLDAHDPDVARQLRLAYGEWHASQQRAKPDQSLHRRWIEYVLTDVLGFPESCIAQGQAISPTLALLKPEFGETLRPDIAIINPQPVTSPEGDASVHQAQLLIQIYPPDQALDKLLPNRRWSAKPEARMMELLRATGVCLGIVTNGEQWMLVHAPPRDTTGYTSWYAQLWLDEPLTLRALRSLLSAKRFFGVSADETLAALLTQSATDQADVTDQLGTQVRRAVELLIQAIDHVDQEQHGALLGGVTERELYEAALTVMMRLVFLFSAEERDLLMIGDKALYEQNYAVGTLGAQLRALADQHGEEVMELRYDAYPRMLATFRAVHAGTQDDRLQLPAYGGSLFDPDRYPFLEGRAAGTRWKETLADPLPINNRVTLHLLDALQILKVKVPGGGAAEPRRLSFRALDVTQIGPVYEGLLDHAALRASEPVLGLIGTKNREPEIPLSKLSDFIDKSDISGLIEFLREETGRSESALRRALPPSPDSHTTSPPGGEGRGEGKIGEGIDGKLRAACHNDAALLARIAPFAALIREDDYGRPVIIRAGSLYVTQATTRRATGTHYTPSDFADPIVRQALEPLVYVGPAEGLPQAQWQLRSPAELLQLKVCDMAMGSAAFLVQTCKYLADRLVEAWQAAEMERGGAEERGGTGEAEQGGIGAQEKGGEGREVRGAHKPVRITPEGVLSTGKPGEQLIPLDKDERVIFARRIVADRCLYGVDKNPMAVEIAKLSLWLVTMDRGRPFSFLDHALKHGDSLVGADEDMFERWTHSLAGTGDPGAMTLYDATLREQLELARAKRRELESFDVQKPEDAERKAVLHREAESAMARVKLGCDLIIGTKLLGLKPKEQQARQAELVNAFMAGTEAQNPHTQQVLTAARKEAAFHWHFEFPEVFEKGGFSACIGNPPFVGGGKISDLYGDPYRNYLVEHIAHRKKGSADLCAYFFLRACENLRNAGYMGLIATNTISQGDTREVGLDQLVNQGMTIYRAVSSCPWPGEAKLEVSIVWLRKGNWITQFDLNNHLVNGISSYLTEGSLKSEPYRLIRNTKCSFKGHNVYGLGFVLGVNEAKTLLSQNPLNADVIMPFSNAEDLNTVPDQRPERFVINFRDWSLDKASRYPECLQIIRERVKPDRDQNPRASRREKWWLFGDYAGGLAYATEHLKYVLVCPIVSKYVIFVYAPNTWLFSHRLAVFTFTGFTSVANLQSDIHECWARNYSSTLETRLNYSASDCFETFPFPQSPMSNLQSLETIGETYHEHRRQIMLARQEGLTKTYNRFHDQRETSADIVQLRALHVEMDNAVAAAYGWTDLALGHSYHETAQGMRYTIGEPARVEVLARLLRLNHERWEEEQRSAGAEVKGSKRAGGKGRAKKGKVLKEEGEEYRLL